MDDIRVFEINDHTTAFYTGRNWERRIQAPNWFDDGAMKLGIATYAVHKNGKAVVYDTFADTRQAVWVRRHLERMGIKRFTVVLSHWHLDHIAGNEIYRDSDIVSNTLTRTRLAERQADIETGCCEGPPEIKPLILPDITFDGKACLYLDDLRLELRQTNIHSQDGTILFVPEDNLLLAGDTLEDPITYIDEVEHLCEHVDNLKQLKRLSVSTILPNHGDPDVIANGGYDKTLIDATINYLTRMLRRVHDNDFLKSSMGSVLREELQQGWIHYHEAYEKVHQENLMKVRNHFKNRRLPSF